MTINLKNFLTDKNNLSKMGEFQNLKQIETLFKYPGYLIGKTGIENIYDGSLRGSFGKKSFEVDAKGRFLKELDSIEPINGNNILIFLINRIINSRTDRSLIS